MAEEFKTQTEKSKEGWYWCTGDDGNCFGPFETEEIARREMWDDGWGKDQYADICEEMSDGKRPSKEEFIAGWEWVSYLARQPIKTGVFNADVVLQDLEEENEESIWHDSPPEWSDASAKRELELMLADALYRWGEKHGAWEQFRALS